MSEPGFEVAAAYVRVSPDASDFAAALDEQVGGLTLSVGVTPNAADFAAALDEALGGLSVSVAVTPDASDFAASLDEQAGGLSLSVAVTPDAADFEASLLEQAGGITVPVTVTAEAAGVSGLGDSVSEQAGTISVPVTPVPEVSGFEDALGEQAGDMSVPVQVYPDTSADDFQSQLDDRVGTPVVGVDVQAAAANVAERIADSLTGAIPVPVVPDVADFADRVAEETAGLTVTAQVVPDTSGDSLSLPVTPDMADFDGAVQEGAGGLTAVVAVIPSPESLDALPARVEEGTADITVPVTVTPVVPADFGAQVSEQAGSQTAGVSLGTGDTAEGLASVTQAEESAAAGASALSAADSALQEQFASLSDQMEDLQGRLSVLDSSFAAVGASGSVADDEMMTLGGVMDGLNLSFAAVHDEVSSLGSELTAAGADAASSAEQLGLVSTMVGELAGNLSQAEDAVSTAGTDLDALGAAADAAQERAAGMNASMSGTAGAAQEAASGASALSTEYGALQDQFTAMEGELDRLDAVFGDLSGGMVSTSGEAGAVAAALDSLNSQFAAVGSEVSSFGSEMAGAGADASGSAEQLGLLSSMLGELEGNLAGAEDDIGTWISSMAAARDAAGTAGAQVDVLAGSAGALSDAAPVAADAAEGLSGVVGELAGRLSYMAVDPFMWMYAAPVVIAGVSTAIKALSDNSMGLVTELAKQDDATGYNISGYQELSGQLGNAAATMQSLNTQVTTLGDSVGKNLGSISGTTSDVKELNQASAQYSDIAQNQIASLGTLSDTYGATQSQAELLATAAGVTYKEMGGVGESAQKAVTAVEAYGTANETASTAVGQLTQDQEVFSSSAFTATSRVSDMDNAFTTLAGNFISVQTAQLNVTGGFDALEAASQAAGASMKGTNTQSVGLQQSFYAQASAIEQAANAMVQNGDSAQTVTGYINTQITSLSKYEGGSKDATTAVQGLKNWEDSLTGSLQTQGSYLSTTLSNDLDNAILKYSGTQTAVNNYANALVDFGKNSPQAKNAQDLLTDSIVKGGNAAGESTGQIAQMISQMEKIPLKEAIQIVLSAEGQYTVSGTAVAPVAVNGGLTNVPGTNLGPVVAGHAGGGLVTGGSRQPRADDIPAMLSHGEYVVNAGAASKYGTGFLDSVNAGHFASGGSVSGSYSGDAAGLGSFLAGNYNSTNTMLIQAVENAMAGAISSAQGGEGGGSAKAPIIVNFNGTQYPTAEQQQALMTQLSALVGVS
jgi:hypothetical protein